MKKPFLKFTNLLFILSIILFSLNLNVLSIDIIDPMLLKALNNSIKQFIVNRSETQEILDKDIPYVISLNASNYQISDISGLENFIYIQSTIDLSYNKIEDISPLINLIKNKDDPNLKANIFLGGNPILFTDNYKQIYTLLKMNENIKIYDSQRQGEGVMELIGFLNGRPADKLAFDDLNNNNASENFKLQSDIKNKNPDLKEKNDDNNELYNGNNTKTDIDNVNIQDELVNTGRTVILIYIISCMLILFILWWDFYKLEKFN